MAQIFFDALAVFSDLIFLYRVRKWRCGDLLENVSCKDNHHFWHKKPVNLGAWLRCVALLVVCGALCCMSADILCLLCCFAGISILLWRWRFQGGVGLLLWATPIFFICARPLDLSEDYSVLSEDVQQKRICLEDMVPAFEEGGCFALNGEGFVIVNHNDGVDEATRKCWQSQQKSEEKHQSVVALQNKQKPSASVSTQMQSQEMIAIKGLKRGKVAVLQLTETRLPAKGDVDFCDEEGLSDGSLSSENYLDEIEALI